MDCIKWWHTQRTYLGFGPIIALSNEANISQPSHTATGIMTSTHQAALQEARQLMEEALRREQEMRNKMDEMKESQVTMEHTQKVMHVQLMQFLSRRNESSRRSHPCPSRILTFLACLVCGSLHL